VPVSVPVTEGILERVVTHVDPDREKRLDGWRVHRICCRVTIRRDTISFTVDSTNAVEVATPSRCRAPSLGKESALASRYAISAVTRRQQVAPRQGSRRRGRRDLAVSPFGRPEVQGGQGSRALPVPETPCGSDHRRDTISFTVDSTSAVEIAAPSRGRAPSLGHESAFGLQVRDQRGQPPMSRGIQCVE
jgi:hypothetical protein